MIELKPTSERSMQSDSQSLLIFPRARTASYGDRNFRVFAPVLWNKLPTSMHTCDGLVEFKRQLKIYLFTKAFN